MTKKTLFFLLPLAWMMLSTSLAHAQQSTPDNQQTAPAKSKSPFAGLKKSSVETSSTTDTPGQKPSATKTRNTTPANNDVKSRYQNAKKEVRVAKRERKAAQARENAARARAQMIRAEKRAQSAEKRSEKADTRAEKARQKSSMRR